jgi:carbon monoxide dehydrogenase subunit G
MTGEHRIPAPRQRVWEALNDPAVLQRCITGCEEVVKVSDTEFTAKVVAKVGPVKAKFAGKVTLSDMDPPSGYVITGEGTGGVAGFGKGGASVRLVDDEGGGTVLTYTAHASVGGKLAQIGSRLVDATARKMADEFFVCFAQTVGDQAEAQAADPVVTAPTGASATPAEVEARVGGPSTAGGARTTTVVSTDRAEAAQPSPRPGPATEAAALAAAASPEIVAGMEAPGRLGAAPDGGLSPKVWIPGLIVIVALLLWAFA